MQKILDDKQRLEQEVENMKSNSSMENRVEVVEELKKRIEELKDQVDQSEMRAENLELGNQSLMDTVDKLTK